MNRQGELLRSTARQRFEHHQHAKEAVLAALDGNRWLQSALSRTNPVTTVSRDQLHRAVELTDGAVLVDALTAADAEAHWAGEDEEQARRFGWYPKRSSIERVREFLADTQRQRRENGSRRTWAIRDATTRTLLGGCEARLQGDGKELPVKPIFALPHIRVAVAGWFLRGRNGLTVHQDARPMQGTPAHGYLPRASMQHDLPPRRVTVEPVGQQLTHIHPDHSDSALKLARM